MWHKGGTDGIHLWRAGDRIPAAVIETADTLLKEKDQFTREKAAAF